MTVHCICTQTHAHKHKLILCVVRSFRRIHLVFSNRVRFFAIFVCAPLAPLGARIVLNKNAPSLARSRRSRYVFLWVLNRKTFNLIRVNNNVRRMLTIETKHKQNKNKFINKCWVKYTHAHKYICVRICTHTYIQMIGMTG